MLRHSLSSVSEHDADWDMCAFLARLLPVCKPVSRLTSDVRWQEYSRYLDGAVGERELRERKNDDKASPYLVQSTPCQHTEHISAAVVPQDAGRVWHGVGNEWSAWSETESLAMQRNGCPLPLSGGDHAIVTREQRQPDIP